MSPRNDATVPSSRRAQGASREKRIETTRSEGVRLGSALNLEDFRPMLVYDGLVTIGKALHHARQGSAAAVPCREDVGRQWSLLQSRHRVQSTSGLICLTSGSP